METKTVSVHCGVCAWKGRRYRTEMRGEPIERPPCPKCKRRTVYYRSPAIERSMDIKPKERKARA